MINGKLFTKFQKLMPKMKKGLKARKYYHDVFFAAAPEGMLLTDGFCMLVARTEGAVADAFAVTELPKTAFCESIEVDVGKYDVTFKGSGVAVSVAKDETGKEKNFDGMRVFYIPDKPAYDTPGCITVHAPALKNLLEAFDGNVQIEITDPEDALGIRLLYIHGDGLQGMLFPVRPAENDCGK